MDNAAMKRLVNDLIYTFTPFAFSCSCEGEEKTCREVLNDPVMLAKKYQVDRIARYIEENYIK